MNLDVAFKKMKAKLKIVTPSRGNQAAKSGYSIDVRNGEFIISKGIEENIDIQVLDSDAKDRHVLLNITVDEGKHKKIKHKWLCGHDERDWFVGAIPGSAKNIFEAKEALKPKEVVEAEKSVSKKNKHKRNNKVRIRQGEWFFVPKPDLQVPEYAIHKKEPISRGASSKPHIVDEIYREGGSTVYVKGSKIITTGEYNSLDIKERHQYQARVGNAKVYARGNVKHKDHATIYLDGWHQVLMNSENLANSKKNLIFLD